MASDLQMNDKTLLELAAKAAGIEHPGGDHSIANDGRLWDCNGLRWWNPLTSNDDALRLAVKLKMNVDVLDDCVGAQVLEKVFCSEPIGKDPYAATRRAIVRAAAEIGKSA